MIIKDDVIPLPGKVLVKDLQFGETKTKAGLIIVDDDGKERGIHPRWAQVWKVGDGVEDIQPGEWVLIEHGRWSRTIKVDENGTIISINLVDYPDGILMKNNKLPG